MDTLTAISPATRRHGIDRGLFHLCIAFFLLPGYFLLGAEFKLLMIPYVFFLLLSTKASYFPALLVHFLPGSVVSQAILLGCAVLPLLRFNKLRGYQLKTLYFVSALPLLLLASVAAKQFIALEQSWVEVARYPALYLGLFGFFYGVLIADEVDRRVVERVLWVLLISVLLQVSGLVESTIRYIFLGLPLLTAVAVVPLIVRRKIEVSLLLRVSPILFVPLIGMGWLGVTFTLVFSAILAILLVMAHSLGTKLIRVVPVGKALGVGAILLLVYVMAATEGRMGPSHEARGIRDIATSSDVLPALEYKAFGDRGRIWLGTWKTLVREGNLWPPVYPPPIVYETYRRSILEAGFGAHNIGLELLRYYGFLVGFVGIVVYLTIIALIGRVFVSRSVGALIVTLGAAVLTTAVVGGLVGQFVLMNNFSLLLMGLAGIIYGSTVEKNRLHTK